MRHPSSLICLLLALAGVSGIGSPNVTLDLAGQGWSIALDPTATGLGKGWHQPQAQWTGARPHPRDGWDEVTVPHDHLTDPRYAYTGVTWYRRSIAVPATEGRSWRLEFDAVFQRCRVWLNGKAVGSHEGGYTPFDFDVTPLLLPGRENFLVVEVDNRVKFRALPGARSGNSANSGQYPWLNYGGILGGVRLVARPPVWIARQKIEAQPQADGSARLTVKVRVQNDRPQAGQTELSAVILDATGERLPVTLTGKLPVAAKATAEAVLQATVPAGTYVRWELESPRLYRCEVTLAAEGGLLHESAAQFGFRSLEMREAKFLLNGRPVRLAGANRARGHPVHGGLDPDGAVEQDLRLMKDAGLRFARLQHTAPGKNLLEWADREGMLLILEVGMWGYLAEDVASAELRAQFQAEMRELMELAWNHPSVVGWSLGNEYESWTPEGIAWTRDMAQWVKAIDPTRPVTFAALGRELRELAKSPAGAERAFDHVDFIAANIYFPLKELPQFLDPVHTRWPGKPVLITEYGLRADRVKSEQERIDHFDAMLAHVRDRPWICGFSYWSFNDYASRYPGTGDDGFRRWGLVDEFRRPRPLYEHMRAKLRDGF